MAEAVRRRDQVGSRDSARSLGRRKFGHRAGTGSFRSRSHQRRGTHTLSSGARSRARLRIRACTRHRPAVRGRKIQKAFILDLDRKPIVPSSTPVAPSLNIPLLDRLRAAEGDYVPLGELGPDLAAAAIRPGRPGDFRLRGRATPLSGRGLSWAGDSGSVPTRSSMLWRRGESGGGSRSGIESRAPTIWLRGREHRRPTMAWSYWPTSRRPAEVAGDGRGPPLLARRS